MNAAWRGGLCSLLLFIAAHGAALPQETVRTSKDCDPNDRYYFPAAVPDSAVSGLDDEDCDWYSRHLRSMDEPSLQYRAADGNARALRLLALPDRARPFVLRFEPAGKGWRLTERATDGVGGDRVGKPVFEQDRGLTKDEASRLDAALAALDLAQMPTEVPFTRINPVTGEQEEITVFGTPVVLEVVRDGRYRVFVRYWIDMVEPEFREIFQVAEGLSEWLRRQKEAGEQE